MTQPVGLPSRLRTVAGPLLRQRAVRRYRTGLLHRSYPHDVSELKASRLGRDWWYYSVELLPEVVMSGHYPAELPMLPRIMLRRCAVEGMSCLDIGTMEGLVPVLMAKRGAHDVLAVDFSNGSVGKLAAVQHYHGVRFKYRSVGLMYRLDRRLRGRGFDLINCSGLLYHVFSPLMVLAAVRPLIKRGGLLLVSTIVTLDSAYTMRFNAAGQLQAEANTFWYPSARLFDYLLRYMRLRPIDAVFLPHSALSLPGLNSEDKTTGYLSVVCRASDSADADKWMRDSAATSWEYRGLTDWARADRQRDSTIRYRSGREEQAVELEPFVARAQPVPLPAREEDSHVLRLSAVT